MKDWLRGVFYSLPIQLLFLHFRKYQVLLVFWFVLFSTVNGTFMKTFGADSLYLAPEYLGNVNSISAALVGGSIAMFIMSWNIATFILFSRHFKFLAAANNPFLKYCINNSIIPLAFLVFYFIKAFAFAKYKELIGTTEIFFLGGGFLCGLFFVLAVSFLYFFGADRTIYRRMLPIINDPKQYINQLQPLRSEQGNPVRLMKVEWYLETPFTRRRARDVSHYSESFLDSIFKRHHFAAVLSVFVAFIFLVCIGFFLENRFFQIPAAASITIFFAILIGVAGAITYFLQSWSLPYLLLLILALNFLYKAELIDPRNKAYGLNYVNKDERPSYSRETMMALVKEENKQADTKNMIGILERWKHKQPSSKPLLVLVNTSGGGHRSATFTMKILQELDSLTNGGFLDRTVMISGASGGMLGAAYFRELFLRRKQGQPINPREKKYVDDISGDLLNPVFSSFVARDLISPAQKFEVGPYSYIKDRGYAFEEKLNDNTRGFLNKQLRDYKRDEEAANIPLMLFCSVVTRDARRMIISTQPVRFMMQPLADTTNLPSMDPDAIDFTSFFAKQDPYNLRMLSAMRMNATFPIVLPNVWLPSNPVIDVMDAGLRDNYGQETALRFMKALNEWIRENTSGVLIVQVRDRAPGGWEFPYLSDDISDHATKPFFLLQYNWYKMMEYSQNDMLTYYSARADYPIHKVIFEYASEKSEGKAALNFHLTEREKQDILSSVSWPDNVKSFEKVINLFSRSDSTTMRAE